MRAVDRAFHRIVHSIFTSEDININGSDMRERIIKQKMEPKSVRVGSIVTFEPPKTRYTLPFYVTDSALQDFFLDGSIDILDYFFEDRVFVTPATLLRRSKNWKEADFNLLTQASIESAVLSILGSDERDLLRDNEMLDRDYCISATIGDHPSTFQWCTRRCAFFVSSVLFRESAKHGSMAMLDWLYNEDVKQPEYSTGYTPINFSFGSPMMILVETERLKAGHLHAIGICTIAAEHGQLDVLKWCYDRGVPWNSEVASKLASSPKPMTPEEVEERMDAFDWLDYIGCPFDVTVIDSALGAGQLKLGQSLWGFARQTKTWWEEEFRAGSISLWGASSFIRKAVDGNDEDQSVAMDMMNWLVLELKCRNPAFVHDAKAYQNPFAPFHVLNVHTDRKILHWALDKGFPVESLVTEAAQIGMTDVLEIILKRGLIKKESLHEKMEEWKASNKWYYNSDGSSNPDPLPKVGDRKILVSRFADWVDTECPKIDFHDFVPAVLRDATLNK